MAEGATEPFHERLSGEQQRWLASTIGKGPKNFQLLYSAQRDTCSPDAFHRHCDNKGPTVTVLYNLSGTIYGGYTSKSWTKADGEYEMDSLAFLFQLQKDERSSLKKIPCTDTEHAIYHNRKNAAVFGKGHDLHLMNRCTALGDSGTFALDGEINFYSYMLEGMNTAEFCNNTLEVEEIEVYSVSEVAIHHPEKFEDPKDEDAPILRVPVKEVKVSSSEEELEDDAIVDAPILDVSEEEVTVSTSKEEEDDSTAVESITDSVGKMKISSQKEKGKDSAIAEGVKGRKWDYFSNAEMRLLLEALKRYGPKWSSVVGHVKLYSDPLPNAAYYRSTDLQTIQKRLSSKVAREMPGIKGDDIRIEAAKQLDALIKIMVDAKEIAGAGEDQTNSESGTSRDK